MEYFCRLLVKLKCFGKQSACLCFRHDFGEKSSLNLKTGLLSCLFRFLKAVTNVKTSVWKRFHVFDIIAFLGDSDSSALQSLSKGKVGSEAYANT